jgi:GTPase
MISVESGKGGDGLIAFRREKFVPFGGPSGGDGGRGGDVLVRATPNLTTLYELSFNRVYKAPAGRNGGAKDMEGANGDHLVIEVPVGTLVYDAEQEELLADLSREDAAVIVAQGGRGGRGNARFTSATRQAPRYAEKGEPGQARRLRFELKLLADVGLVGLPNAGKSTFLRAVSNARPKVADYPFTTLVPCLGIIKREGLPSFCMADIPGLIEGAHEGAGLGVQFLKHVERTRVLVHLVDLSQVDPANPTVPFDVIMQELREFSADLAAKPMLVVGNKMDLPEAREAWEPFRAALAARGFEVFSASGATSEGVDRLLRKAGEVVARFPVMVEPKGAAAPEVISAVPTAGPRAAFAIEPTGPGSWTVRGADIERLTAMTDFTNEESTAVFRRKLQRLGFVEALGRLAPEPDDRVFIGEMEFSVEEFLA